MFTVEHKDTIFFLLGLIYSLAKIEFANLAFETKKFFLQDGWDLKSEKR